MAEQGKPKEYWGDNFALAKLSQGPTDPVEILLPASVTTDLLADDVTSDLALISEHATSITEILDALALLPVQITSGVGGYSGGDWFDTDEDVDHGMDTTPDGLLFGSTDAACSIALTSVNSSTFDAEMLHVNAPTVLSGGFYFWVAVLQT